MAKHTVSGSERHPVEGSKKIDAANPREEIEVRLKLRRRNDAAYQELVHRLEMGESVPTMSRKDFADRFGTDAADCKKVHEFAAAHGFKVVRELPQSHLMVLAGTVADFQKSFGVTLDIYDHPTLGKYRGRTGSIQLPDELSEIVTAVLGLDNRPQARPHIHTRPDATSTQHEQPRIAFSPLQLVPHYRFPEGDGRGQCIGIIELGGGYRETDLDAYFGLLGVPLPEVVPIGIGRATNQPDNDPQGADFEVALDVEICGAVAPGAKLAVYFAENTDAGFVEALNTAIHDVDNRPSVISISWGGPETEATKQFVARMNEALQMAALLGITVCISSGDSGSHDAGPRKPDGVDFPASSPFALACGGTRIQAHGDAEEREVVWNDGVKGGATGGGISSLFERPVWQNGLSASPTKGRAVALTHRGVPDVAGNASPASGYRVLLNGRVGVAGGTSAVAPLWAALIARINSLKGEPVGFITPRLYRHPDVCKDILHGNNGGFAGAKGWDACTGIGVPDGEKIAKHLGV
ncbi:S53 family peptidase [Paraburkholderia solisilvae]|uniref:Pseudomonalisin n=1 Tax=Paraburkholderia solisilvae TaxID=624376 RepID=A0A6J5EYV8_9BURK|nr:S53 family peptidase [Paraburkholderia solisilvae]CAB3771264.1 Pseudomonalisin [Paraburkholderia solisilvae]